MPRRLLGFISSFPTATFLYAALVLLGKIDFELLWLLLAIAIDIIDDFLGQILQS
ncbi:MAG: hypothetical protein HYY37_01445 [Candidatus Aenigmarchaeota archaeon]|nr:hypothetical protein [Candidatus Aenigmarchaeota archaeon]